jgi:hypothetical protein
MAFENEASRLRKLAQNPNVLFIWTNHAEVEREKDSIAKIDVENMARRCSVSLVENKRGEEEWRAEGTDIDGRRIAAVVVADERNVQIKVITTWARK